MPPGVRWGKWRSALTGSYNPAPQICGAIAAAGGLGQNCAKTRRLRHMCGTKQTPEGSERG